MLTVTILVLGATEAPARTDVVTGTLGAGAAIAGLVLVFLGTVLAAYQAYPPATPASAKRSHRIAALWVLGAFFLSLVSVAASVAWLALGGGTSLYALALGLFIAELAAVFAVAAYTLAILLR